MTSSRIPTIYPAPGLSEPGQPTIVDLLHRRAVEQPEKPAYVFYVDGSENPESFTYGRMDERARAIGAELQVHAAGDASDVVPRARVCGGTYGCLYAGAIAVRRIRRA